MTWTTPSLLVRMVPMLGPEIDASVLGEIVADTELNDESSCVVCMEDFKEAGHYPLQLACKHICGQNCLQSWVNSANANHNKCFICREKICDPRPRQRRSVRGKQLIELLQACLRFFGEAHWINEQIHGRQEDLVAADIEVQVLNHLLQDTRWSTETITQDRGAHRHSHQGGDEP